MCKKYFVQRISSSWYICLFVGQYVHETIGEWFVDVSKASAHKGSLAFGWHGFFWNWRRRRRRFLFRSVVVGSRLLLVFVVVVGFNLCWCRRVGGWLVQSCLGRFRLWLGRCCGRGLIGGCFGYIFITFGRL